MRLHLLTAICLLAGLTQVLIQGWFSPALGQLDRQTDLKIDVPKLDMSTKNKNATPLKGSVVHSEQVVPKLKAPQNGYAAGSANNGLSGKATSDRGGFLRAKAKRERQDNLRALVESGIGIIGVKFVMAFGRPPVINRVFPGTPAFEQGLRPNDIIVAVDGVPTSGLTKNEVYNMIVGTPHTPVTISVRRRSDFQVKTMDRMDFNELTDPQVRRDYQSM